VVSIFLIKIFVVLEPQQNPFGVLFFVKTKRGQKKSRIRKCGTGQKGNQKLFQIVFNSYKQDYIAIIL